MKKSTLIQLLQDPEVRTEIAKIVNEETTKELLKELLSKINQALITGANIPIS